MDDLISRQAAIDALERKKDKNAKGDISGFYNKIIQNDIDALMQLPSAQPEQQWAPCNERLPEDGADILVTYVDEEETRIIPVNYGRGTWFDCIFNRALDSLKVTAWMPLPKPYEEESDEGK